jgi:hypothetical protein
MVDQFACNMPDMRDPEGADSVDFVVVGEDFVVVEEGHIRDRAPAQGHVDDAAIHVQGRGQIVVMIADVIMTTVDHLVATVMTSLLGVMIEVRAGGETGPRMVGVTTMGGAAAVVAGVDQLMIS